MKIPEKNLDELAGMDLKGKIIVYLGVRLRYPNGAGFALSDSGVNAGNP